jgi:hypothetical protein
MAQPDELPDRIKRDLYEALREGGIDKLPSRPPRRRRSFSMAMFDLRPRNPGQLVLIGVGLFLLGYLLHIPGAPYFITAGVVCVLVAVATHLMQPHGSRPKSWRGRYIYIPPSHWQERIYRIIYRTKR